MTECAGCRTWVRQEDCVDTEVTCAECNAPLPVERWIECREPLGFRTDFRPSTEQGQSQGAARSRSVQAESFPLHLDRVEGTNLHMQVRPSARTYRMNRGQFDGETENWRGFNAIAYNAAQRLAGSRDDYTMLDQWIDPTAQPEAWFTNRLEPVGKEVRGIWLAASKTTDILLAAPQIVANGLALGQLQRARSIRALAGLELVDALHRTAVRAAALSASFILVGRAALELDVDPEEFDIIDPRVIQPSPGGLIPVLQFADYLVNGAGLCSALGTPDPTTGEVALGRILCSIVDDPAQYPLRWFDHPTHREDCDRACYQCLLRHSNQSYHGLLDWRLGMAFLSAVRSADFRCGLDGDFRSPPLRDWSDLVDRSLLDLLERLPGLDVQNLASVRAFRYPGSETWVVVAHPLWDLANPKGVLAEAMAQVGNNVIAVESFTLDRRPWTLRDAVVHGMPAVPARSAATPQVVSPEVHLTRLVQEAEMLGAPAPVEHFHPSSAPGTIRYAWPTKKLALVTTLDPKLEQWLVVEGWASYGPNDVIDSAALFRKLS